MLSNEQLESLRAIFYQHYGLVLGTVRRYAPSADSIEDIVQSVYLDVAQGIRDDKWDLTTDMAPLLYRIAKNKTFSCWKDRKRHQHTSTEELIERLDAALAKKPEDAGYEQSVARLEALERCLERLTPKARLFVQRHYFQGNSIRSIGESEAMNESAIYRFFRQVRLKLRKCMLRILEQNKYD